MRKNHSLPFVAIATAIAAFALPLASNLHAQATLPNDQEIVDKASTYSLDKLVELIGVYDRLGKRQVTQALADEILKRDANNAAALAVKGGRPVAPEINPEETGGPGSAETPEERLANRIDSLQKRRRYSEIISVLDGAKKGYRGRSFPFQDDLADAYFESGNIGAAKSAYREMANSSKYSSTLRTMARRNLTEIENTERIAKADELSIAGKHGEALAIVESMKKNHSGGSFPYENDLGDVLFASGDLDGPKFPTTVSAGGVVTRAPSAIRRAPDCAMSRRRASSSKQTRF